MTTPTKISTGQAWYERLGIRSSDSIFRAVMTLFGLGILALAGIILYMLWDGSALAFERMGFGFISNTNWNPVTGEFGAFPFIAGTLLTSAMALVIAVPVSIGIAVLLAEYAPRWLRDPLTFVVELLAAIPSIVYGLWGLFVLAPFMREHVNPFIGGSPLGWLPIFGESTRGLSLFTASVILAIMITPIITSISREILLAVPRDQREAALALGMTRWESIRHIVLSYGRTGILGACLLGLGRALGETMAVTMVIGNSIRLTYDYFEPGYTMSAVIANEFREAATFMHQSALVAIGLVLFSIALLVNILARLLVARLKHSAERQLEPEPGPVMARVGAVLAPVMRIGRRIGSLFSAFVSAIWRLVTMPFRLAWRGFDAALIAPRRMAFRLAGDKTMVLMCVLALALAVIPLVAILTDVFERGFVALTPDFFTELPRAPNSKTPSGFGNAIAGTGIVVSIAAAIGIPLGVGTGIYLSEFGENRLGRSVRFMAEVLTGLPSIVAGIVAYELVVLSMGNFSAWAGGIALSFLFIPVAAIATQEAMRMVPTSHREAGAALGLNQTHTTLRIVLPAAAGGVITGIMLAIARVAGETAPLLFTAFNSRFWSESLNEPIATLPVQIYVYAISPFKDWHEQAWGGALVLVGLVLLVNVIVRTVWARRARFMRGG